MGELAIASLLDLGISLVLAGMERSVIVSKVQEMETAGATPDEITDALQAMRQQSEADAQKAIDDSPT
jgi:hypothetical protein